MTSTSTRAGAIALVHGPPDFSSRMAVVLAGLDLDVRPASAVADARQAMATGTPHVVVVDCASLDGLVQPGPSASGASATPAPVPAVGDAIPIVAVGCADASAVEAALAAGATIAARVDASDREIRSLVHAAATASEHARDSARTKLDLERHAALLVKDDLTAAYNRRFFDRFLSEQIDAARAAGASVGLVFMDIDNLKAVNLKHGHSMGSLVLKEAASRLIRAVGPDDRVMRYGGDEFCIVMPGRRSGEALALAEAVRKSFAATPFAVDATGGVTLTASFGVACFPEQAGDAAALVCAADKAMLTIKDHKNDIQLAGRA